MNSAELQTHCDNIITLLEKAVQTEVYARHFPSDTQAAIAEKKNDYFKAVKALYAPKDAPAVFENVYQEAVRQPDGIYNGTDKDGNDYTQVSYPIIAGRIVRQLNNDFLPNLPRNCWVSYEKPHVNCIGKITTARIGDPNYNVIWLEEDSDHEFKKNMVYVETDEDPSRLIYTVINPEGQLKIGQLSIYEILELSLRDRPFENPEQESVYAEITIDAGKACLKKIRPFPDMKEEDGTMDLQSKATAIIDRLVDAVYAAIYQKHTKTGLQGTALLAVNQEADERYTFYLKTVEKLYHPNPVPKIFIQIYRDAIDYAASSFSSNNYQLLRYSIRVGGILIQLNQDFVLRNKSAQQTRLIYDKLSLDKLGYALKRPLGTNTYKLISFGKHMDGLSYRVLDPQGATIEGKFTFDCLLKFLSKRNLIRK